MTALQPVFFLQKGLKAFTYFSYSLLMT